MSHHTQTCIMVLGHSFVWRLETFLKETSLPCLPSHLSHSTNTTLRFNGIGGLTVPQLRRIAISKIKRFQPHLLIIEIGTNYLCNPHVTPDQLAQDIFNFVQTCYYHHKVPFTIVNQVLKRNHLPPALPSYNKRVLRLNTLLHNKFRTIEFALFWYHRSLTRAKTPILALDGIHLTQIGNYLLAHSYQNAISRFMTTLGCPHFDAHHFTSHRQQYSPAMAPTTPQPRSPTWVTLGFMLFLLTFLTTDEIGATGKRVTFYPSALIISQDVQPLLFFSDTKLMNLVTELQIIPPSPVSYINSNCSVPKNQFFSHLLANLHQTQRIIN